MFFSTINNMKTDVHPPYFEETKVTCSCGNTFTIGSTQESIHVELCSKCHPFYTGQHKFIDAVGRIERFKQKQAKAKVQIATKKAKEEKAKDEEQGPKTLREMLMEMK